MDIGSKVKNIIAFNNKVEKKISDTFNDILKDVRDSGVEAERIHGIGALKAEIGYYIVTIPISEIVQQLKDPSGNISDGVLDSALRTEIEKNIINQLKI